MHTGFFWEKRESRRPLGRPSYRGKFVINIYNRSALLGFSDVCLPNHDAAFHLVVMSLSKVRFLGENISERGWMGCGG